MKETNMEHFRGEIEAVGHNFALINGKVVKCNRCVKCDFETEPDEEWESCTIKRVVECIRHGWIAADEVGSKMWYEDKPKKDKKPNVWLGKKIVTLNDDYFPFITWEDEEPWSVEDLRKLKVKAGDQDA